MSSQAFILLVFITLFLLPTGSKTPSAGVQNKYEQIVIFAKNDAHTPAGCISAQFRFLLKRNCTVIRSRSDDSVGV